jgi:hypothetical protein
LERIPLCPDFALLRSKIGRKRVEYRVGGRKSVI